MNPFSFILGLFASQQAATSDQVVMAAPRPKPKPLHMPGVPFAMQTKDLRALTAAEDKRAMRRQKRLATMPIYTPPSGFIPIDTGRN